MRDFLYITKALSDETRVRALMALRDEELCLCQLIELLGLAPSTVSKHMTLLQQAGLVQRRKEGRWHFYSLSGIRSQPVVRGALDWALASVSGDSIIASDQQHLQTVCKKNIEELSACYTR